MITLDAGNVLLTPALRRQMMKSLRRAAHLGQRLGDFVLDIAVRRRGRQVTLTAHCRDRRGAFDVRAKGSTPLDAIHALARQVSVRLHDQLLVRATA